MLKFRGNETKSQVKGFGIISEKSVFFIAIKQKNLYYEILN